MKRKSLAPRNPFVAAAKFRKAGKHDKTEKALRRAARMAMQQGSLAEWRGSRLLTCTTRVRFSQDPPFLMCRLSSDGSSACLVSRRSRVRGLQPAPVLSERRLAWYGACFGSRNNGGSNPSARTTHGRLPEWFNGAVLKTDGPHGHGGSNPSPSATQPRRDAGVA